VPSARRAGEDEAVRSDDDAVAGRSPSGTVHDPVAITVPDVGPAATAGEVVRHALARSVVQLLRHDPGARRGDDPEDVHQLRVATRRLRSDLRTFAPLLDEGWVDGRRAELAWLGALVGAVRDADVLTDRLQAQLRTLPDSDAATGAALISRLGVERDAARAAMLAGLCSPRYEALVEQLVCAAREPQRSEEGARMARAPARDLLPGLVHRRWRRLAEAASALGEEPSDLALHRVRILAKRTRYAAEAAAPVVGRRMGRFAAAVEDVQDLLGRHQDAVVAEAWLRAAATAEDALVAGELVLVQQLERDRLRRAWPATWAAASAPKLRRWR
jgi:CHAD domain-containing protein